MKQFHILEILFGPKSGAFLFNITQCDLFWALVFGNVMGAWIFLA